MYFIPKCKNKDGFILVMMLLFLSILSLLAFSILNITLLENKINGFYQDKIKSFYLAEDNLLRAERAILQRGEVNLDVAGVEVAKIAQGECGEAFYRLTVTANYRGAKSVLQSVLVKINDAGNCLASRKITSGRQSFLMKQ